MKFSHFFVDRPIFAGVISIFITIVGLISFWCLPITQYPDIIPPTISISTKYAGASTEVVMNTVSAPIEQSLNGVENMIYMQSQCSSDGALSISATFETGTDVNIAQVMIQNRLAEAESRLPKEVRDIGITVRKRSPDLLMTANLISPNGTRDKLYLTNYAITQIQDRLSRIYGVSDFNIFGAKEYSMRIWLDTYRLSSLNLSPMQVIAALQEQNKQVVAGKLNQPPLDSGSAFELTINAQGRLKTEKEFGNIIVKYQPDGRIIYLRDVARIELGSYQYSNESYINGKSCISMGAYQLPGTNAIDTMRLLKEELQEMKKTFPNDVDYIIGIDSTQYISESVNAVYETIIDAVILVVLVILIFLQNWRAAIIPLFAIPVSLIGTFSMMFAFGFSINNLTLFGLVLAIGIVVDDAIVVVENVERNMHDGLSAREATKKAMTQVQGALIAIVLVLSCVFIPTAFLSGISGQFYRQFAMTIATSTIISGVVSLTLTPALCALMLDVNEKKKGIFTRIWDFTFGWLFKYFNVAFNWVAEKYGRFVALLTRVAVIVILIYAGMLYLTKEMFVETPIGFIPKQDQGYVMVSIQLPEGAAFDRTDEICRYAASLVEKIEGIRYVTTDVGRNVNTGSTSSNVGRLFIKFDDRDIRDKRGLSAEKIIAEVRQSLDDNVVGAKFNILTPAPVRGIGTGSDFKLQLQDRAGYGMEELEKYVNILTEEISSLDSVSTAFSFFTMQTPQLFADIDRERAQKLNVPISAIFQTLQYNLASVYVNDFNILGRVYRVVAMAEAGDRKDISNIYSLKVPNALGQNVPLGSVVTVKRYAGSDRIVRYNLYPSAEIMGNIVGGVSSGVAVEEIEELAARILPQGMGIEWTDIVYQQKKAGNTSIFIFGICIVFVFLLLAALYESWSIPLSVILIVPLVLLFAVSGLFFRGLDNNLMSQIGFVVLIGLACKNAILIVEFAKQREEHGEDLVSAVSIASKNRLRPIMMTSFAFILGVVPLAYSSGSGFELRQALGTSVLYGMLGVTITGCIFTPIFYYVIRKLSRKKMESRSSEIV